MRIGDKLLCTRSLSPAFHAVGKEYEIIGFDWQGDPIVVNEMGHNDHNIGVPLSGNVWDFELVEA